MYVAASPPGVAVQLPTGPRTGATMPQTPNYPAGGVDPAAAQAQAHAQAQAAAQAQAHAQARAQAQAPAQATSEPSPGQKNRSDELIAGAGNTVYEFGGEFSDEARSGGKHQTFYGDSAQFASVMPVEERHSNLSRGRGVSWIVGGLVIAVVGGISAMFILGAPGKDEDPSADGDEVADQAVVGAEVAPESAESGGVVEPVAEAETGAAQPAGETGAVEPAPAPEEPEPALDPEPVPEVTPDPKPAPKPSGGGTTKKKKKSTTKKKKKKSSIVPTKPPRDSGIGGLPAPD